MSEDELIQNVLEEVNCIEKKLHELSDVISKCDNNILVRTLNSHVVSRINLIINPPEDPSRSNHATEQKNNHATESKGTVLLNKILRELPKDFTRKDFIKKVGIETEYSCAHAQNLLDKAQFEDKIRRVKRGTYKKTALYTQ